MRLDAPQEVRFPPRKLYPPDGQAHSPLSPLAPSSPLHPDGIIAPIWIRKHTALVPAVFVLFTRLFELPPTTPRSPLDTTYDPEREQEERKRDTELAADISARKKTATERGIKLTVVLIASRRLLGASRLRLHQTLANGPHPTDDPALDNRLTFIRRTSGLDARASLFVLSPVSAGELEEFVKRCVPVILSHVLLAEFLLLVCKKLSTSLPSSTIQIIPNVYAGSATGMPKPPLRMCLCRPWG